LTQLQIEDEARNPGAAPGDTSGHVTGGAQPHCRRNYESLLPIGSPLLIFYQEEAKYEITGQRDTLNNTA
jgi:hypothetical protein